MRLVAGEGLELTNKAFSGYAGPLAIHGKTIEPPALNQFSECSASLLGVNAVLSLTFACGQANTTAWMFPFAEPLPATRSWTIGLESLFVHHP